MKQFLDFKTITTIASVLTTILTVYFSYLKSVKPSKKSTLYYTNVLLPFIEAYHQNNERNWKKFLRKHIDHTYDYVPPYIFYLMDEKEDQNEKLKKILLNDYSKCYKNDDNHLMHIIDFVHKISSYLTVFFIIFLFILCLLYEFDVIIVLLTYVSEFFCGTNAMLFMRYLMYFVLLLIIMRFLLFVYNNLSKFADDDYTLNKKLIKKHISSKIATYEKNKDKYYY